MREHVYSSTYIHLDEKEIKKKKLFSKKVWIKEYSSRFKSKLYF